MHLPAESAPITFGAHGAVAAHYKIPPGAFEEHASTLDFIVGATAGCLAGTFARALEARQISATSERLQTEAVGEIELEGNVLVIRRIHVKLRLKAGEKHRDAAVRAHGFFADQCPTYLSLRKAITITTELLFEPIAES
jgi:uncharacterized OsmC-like protein